MNPYAWSKEKESTCKMCGKVFKTAARNVKFCSDCRPRIYKPKKEKRNED